MGCGVCRREACVDDAEILEAQKVLYGAPKQTSWLTFSRANFIKKKENSLLSNYKLQRKLGSGAYGCVFLAKSRRLNQKRAIKTLQRVKMNQYEKQKFDNEVNILKSLDHPNVVKIYEFYEENQQYHIVTELCEGGQLFDFIISHWHISEEITKSIMQQVLQAIAYCHDQNVIHRDLKPENLLIEKRNIYNLVVKVADFGTAVFSEPYRVHKTRVGSALYIAPEVLGSEYNSKCDIWSLGVIFYILLCGKPPYIGKTEHELMDKVMNDQILYPESDWKNVSAKGKALTMRMLNKDQKIRLTARECLEDEYFRDTTANTKRKKKKKISQELLRNIQQFNADRKLQLAVMTYITSQIIDVKDHNELLNTFQILDENGDGKLSKEEILNGYRAWMGHDLGKEELNQIFDQADTDNSGFIDYSEFLNMAWSKRKFLSQSNLEQAFSDFDQDGNGAITKVELRDMLSRQNSVPWETFEDAISEVDLDGDGVIDLKEFKTMMLRLL